MKPVHLFNTLHRRVEPFEPGNAPGVLMYTCGPTVYRPVHIGNLRSYLLADWLRRALTRFGYEVRQVVNITDVGHMRQDQLDLGEDKVVAAALAAGQTPAQIAAFYTAAYQQDLKTLNILPAAENPRATDHVPEMIGIIERLLARGHAYLAAGNVYFEVASFPGYGQLSGNTQGEDLAEGVRVQADPAKRDPRDFALWKGAEPGRSLQWPSPWGPGFPGWHIECSAMSLKHLGEQLDLHTGGVDNIFPHHEDERAQSEAATGRQFVRHWVHGQHLLVDGLKMAKSTGNSYTLADLRERGFDPMAFRYLCLTAHYRHRLNFTFTALLAAQRALDRIRLRVAQTAPRHDSDWSAPWLDKFEQALANDLNLPEAVGVLWQMLHAHGDEAACMAALLDADAVLGLGLASATSGELPQHVTTPLHLRARARASRDFARADQLREAIHAEDYQVIDEPGGSRVVARVRRTVQQGVTRSEEIPNLLDQPDSCEITVGVVVNNALDDLQRCLGSVSRHCDGRSLEIVVVDNGSTDGTRDWLSSLVEKEPRLRVVSADHNLGEGAGRNAVLKQARGRNVVLMDSSIELTGDPFGSIVRSLEQPGVGAVGAYGLRAHTLHRFEPTEEPNVDALEGYLMALKRALVPEVGLMDEKYRFYRNLDIDYSFQIRERGYGLVGVAGLPLIMHPHRIWHSLGDEQREALSKKNFNRFLHRWRHRAQERLAIAGMAG